MAYTEPRREPREWDALKAASERHDPPAAAMWAGLHVLLVTPDPTPDPQPQTQAQQGVESPEGVG